MQLGFLYGMLRSVDEVIDDADLNGSILAVHGVLYSGPEFGSNEVVLLPKRDWFNGTGVADVRVDGRNRAVRVDDPDLAQRLAANVSVAFGGFRYKFDCVAIGKVGHDRDSGFGAHIGDLNLLIFQSWREMGSRQQLYVMCFPGAALPALPWVSTVDFHGIPALRMVPLESN